MSGVSGQLNRIFICSHVYPVDVEKASTHLLPVQNIKGCLKGQRLHSA